MPKTKLRPARRGILDFRTLAERELARLSVDLVLQNINSRIAALANAEALYLVVKPGLIVLALREFQTCNRCLGQVYPPPAIALIPHPFLGRLREDLVVFPQSTKILCSPPR
jgi:hypothetical protein